MRVNHVLKTMFPLLMSIIMLLSLFLSPSFAYYGGEKLYEKNLISGSGVGEMVLREDDPFTREQLALIILEMNGLKEIALRENGSPVFSDAEQISSWAKPYVAYCVNHGFMKGVGGQRFAPQDTVKGKQLAYVLLYAAGYRIPWNELEQVLAQLGMEIEDKALTRGEAFDYIWDVINRPITVRKTKLIDDLGKNQFLPSSGTGTYTYRSVWASQPNNWNPHAWEMSHESVFMDYTVAPLTYSTFDGQGGWRYAYDAATAVTDITATFADKEKYGVPADATEKYVYEIKLRPEMKWDNGDPITADDYVYSMKMMLDSKMKNYRSNSYTSGESEIANAAAYFNNDKAGKPVYKDVKDAEIPEGAKVYVTMTMPVYFFGNETAKSYYEDEYYAARFTVGGVNLYEKYSTSEIVEFNEAEMKADLNAIAAEFGDENEEAYKEFLIYDDGEVYSETPWEKVGLVKVDDYTILYITQKPLESFYMHSALTSNWLVHKATYEAAFTKVNGLVATDYCTKMENTRSCGPYMIASFENNKQIVLVRNPYYWAYKDGKYNPENEMYRADKIVIDIVQDTDRHEGLFLSGKSDSLFLSSDQVPKYRKSSQISFVDETYTLREIFATSLESLQSRDWEKGSGKRVVLSNKNFRKALSRSIDRAKFCEEATSGFKPAYFLLNSLYYYDMANDPDSIYRNSSYAKKAVLNLYDVKYTDDTVDAEYAKITGRDLGEAKELFRKAYDELVAAGLYTEGEEVPIEIMVAPGELKLQHMKQQELLNQFYNEGAAGTPFEGKIKVIYESGDKRRYENVAAGKNMAIHGAWGGAAFYPFSTIRVYTNPGYMGGLLRIHESNGWNPSVERLEMTIKRADGTTVTESRTFEDWSDQINIGGKYEKNTEERLQVLAQLEAGILGAYQCIPLGTYTNSSLISYKVSEAMKDYHIMYGFGGFRYLKFNYNDEEWDAYLKKNQYHLNYQ